jgi:hypothetical protein
VRLGPTSRSRTRTTSLPRQAAVPVICQFPANRRRG